MCLEDKYRRRKESWFMVFVKLRNKSFACNNWPVPICFSQFVSDPCASNPCHHGNCSTSGDGYLCLCSEGYEGTNCERSFHSLPVSEQTELTSPRQNRPTSSTLEPDVVLPRSRATVTLPTWQPKEGQKVVDLKWDETEVRIFCLNENAQKRTLVVIVGLSFVHDFMHVYMRSEDMISALS